MILVTIEFCLKKQKVADNITIGNRAKILSDLRVPVQLFALKAVEETMRLSSVSGEQIIY